MRWGDTHLAGDDGPPLVLEHTCGHTLAARVVCGACGEPVRARDTRPVSARDTRPVLAPDTRLVSAREEAGTS
jgi:hypothetical protein